MWSPAAEEQHFGIHKYTHANIRASKRMQHYRNLQAMLSTASLVVLYMRLNVRAATGAATDGGV